MSHVTMGNIPELTVDHGKSLCKNNCIKGAGEIYQQKLSKSGSQAFSGVTFGVVPVRDAKNRHKLQSMGDPTISTPLE